LKRNHWIITYAAILAVHIVGIAIDSSLIESITKPMLLICLMFFFIQHSQTFPGSLRVTIIMALLLSWLGDVLLMFQVKDELFFLLGLGAFLLAHIAYIVFLHKVRVRESIRSNAWFLLLIVAYYSLLLSFLSPYLGDMKLAVRIYGLVISFMFLLALHMIFLANRHAGRLLVSGATLFVISDSVLAINKFYQSFEGSGIIIMFTYGLAQLFLVLGALNYASKK